MFDFNAPPSDYAVIKVFGVGKGGISAVNHMIDSRLAGLEFVGVGPASQGTEGSRAPENILVEGTAPGQAGTPADRDRLARSLQATNMAFIVHTLGCEVSTAAATAVAEAARERDILTVALVARPFFLEGRTRRAAAEAGFQALRQRVDCIVGFHSDRVIGSDGGGTLTMTEALARVGQTLQDALGTISRLILPPLPLVGRLARAHHGASAPPIPLGWMPREANPPGEPGVVTPQGAPSARPRPGLDQKQAARREAETFQKQVSAITSTILLPGLICTDFADVRLILKDAGTGEMAFGEGRGPDRVESAVAMVFRDPSFLENLKRAKSLLMNIPSTQRTSLHEVNRAASRLQEVAHPDSNIILAAPIGKAVDEETFRIGILATGFEPHPNP